MALRLLCFVGLRGRELGLEMMALRLREVRRFIGRLALHERNPIA
jgi:hypothetical protein